MSESQIPLLSESKFYKFVIEDYEPSSYELFGPEDTRFTGDTSFSHVCKTRCFRVYREIATRVPNGAKVIDLGLYPGTMVRQLKTLLGSRVLCYGGGLKVAADFQEHMGPYLESCVNTELDPFYAAPDVPVRVPHEDNMFDAVIATEILEHLISPVEAITEMSRILRAGGISIITTPNVSHAGSVFKILLGRSNYERLDRSLMYLQDDEWRGHIRFYDKRELETLFGRHGLQLVHHSYYNEQGWGHARKSLVEVGKSLMKSPLALIPRYKRGHFAVFQKT